VHHLHHLARFPARTTPRGAHETRLAARRQARNEPTTTQENRLQLQHPSRWRHLGIRWWTTEHQPALPRTAAIEQTNQQKDAHESPRASSTELRPTHREIGEATDTVVVRPDPATIAA